MVKGRKLMGRERVEETEREEKILHTDGNYVQFEGHYFPKLGIQDYLLKTP